MEDILSELDWTGFYCEGPFGRGWMNMRLQFREGTVKGEGVDRVGTWHLDGVYSLDDRSCSWIKRYLGQHTVNYAGNVTPNGIEGRWNVDGLFGDSFHIWPVSMTHIQQAYLDEEDPLNR